MHQGPKGAILDNAASNVLQLEKLLMKSARNLKQRRV